MEQLALLPPPPAADDSLWLERLERYITGGKSVELSLSMTVCALHQLWDDLWFRANGVSEKLENFAARCVAKAAQSHSRAEKIRLNKLAQRARAIGGMAASIPEELFGAAQNRLSESLPLDDDLHDEFWQDVGQRPGIEHTWSLTLQQVLNHLK